jgi:cytoskeletal protein RodZ
MRGRYKSGQGGSLAGFIIVGVLLALVLVGGLYGLNRYNAQKASEETAAKQEDKKTSQDKTKTNQETAKKDDSDKSKSNSSSSQAQPDIPKDTTTSTDSGSSNQTAQSNVLPHTGPSDMTIGLLAVTLLSFSAAHFVQSRRSRI